MRRISAILLVVAFIGIGSGALSWVHELAHAAEDSRMAAALPTDAGDRGKVPHSENNCNLHAILRAPLASTHWVPLLVLIGLFVAFVSQLSPSLVSHRLLDRIDCRGPPVR